jgi:hypothetical protein
MQTIQLNGTFSFADNIRALKIGEPIKLVEDANNRISNEAIAAYTLSGRKIGYVPFKKSQINIKAKYKVEKLGLTLQNPVLLISREIDSTNIINIESDYIKKIKYSKIKSVNYPHMDDVMAFKKYLQAKGNIIDNIFVTYYDENYINLLIYSEGNINIFNTVTRKYYEENIFKYDDLYKLGIIPKSIFQPFQIHRLEDYIEKKYKNINKLLSKRLFKKDKILESNIFEDFNIIDTYNFGFEKIADIKKYQKVNIDLMIHNLTTSSTINEIKEYFNNIMVGGICYNTMIKYYCNIHLYDDDSIVEIIDNETIDYNMFINLLMKLVISGKTIVNVLNPFDGFILRLEIPEFVLTKIQENI